MEHKAEQKTEKKKLPFLSVVSLIYLVASAAIIALAVYGLVNNVPKLGFDGVTQAVFAVIGGVLGLIAGVMGLVSRRFKRCRIAGLIALLVAIVPLAISLIAGEKFAVYWKSAALMVLPFFYLIAALFRRSAPKREPAPAAAVEPAAAVAEQKPAVEPNGK